MARPSMGVRVEVKGLDPLVKGLRRAGDKDALRAIRLANKDGAEIVAEEAKAEVPHLSGKLGKSIRANATPKAGKVVAGKAAVPYAGVIHFGWPAHSIKPQPFIYEAMDKRSEEVFAAYAKQIETVVNNV